MTGEISRSSASTYEMSVSMFIDMQDEFSCQPVARAVRLPIPEV